MVSPAVAAPAAHRRALAKAAMAGDDPIRADMAEVEFCDLAGLRVIVSLVGPGTGRATVRQVVLGHLPAHLAEIMRILGWDPAPGLVVREPGR
jgi:STAS domain